MIELIFYHQFISERAVHLIKVPIVLLVLSIQWVLVGIFPTTSMAADITGAARVVDGDTIDVGTTRIRLWGIDAPESKQLCQRDGAEWMCGRDAALALERWIGQRTVSCEEKARDRYGRTVGLCRVDGDDVSAWMVSNGYAVAFRRYSADYIALEEKALEQRRGIWSSEFQMPWDWRLQRKAE